MRKHFYPRLAARSLRLNGKFYLPYLLTIVGCSAAFYILCALSGARDLPDKNRYAYLLSFLMIGEFLIGAFSLVFLFYTNSFLMKRRSRELGLYNVLGMDKRNLGRMLWWETVYTALLGIGGGLAAGLLLQKLVTMFLFWLTGFDTGFAFHVSGAGLGLTAVLFSAILLLTLLRNLLRVRAQRPVELLNGSGAGEREPRARWLLAVLGAAALGAGYVIALTTRSALQAAALYFVAVFLVIIGTYCLFTAGSIALLKLLRRNRGYYYRTAHFIGVSGMLHRMKRNAVGLANICILSTMVLVMISGTLSLYLGTGDAIRTRYPADIIAELRYDPGEGSLDTGRAMANLTDAIGRQGLRVNAARSCGCLSFAVGRQNGAFTTTQENQLGGAELLVALTAEDYARLGGGSAELAADEIWLYSPRSSLGDTLTIRFTDPESGRERETRSYRVTERLSEHPPLSDFDSYFLNIHYLVVADQAALEDLWRAQRGAYGENASSLRWTALFDTDGSDQAKTDCAVAVSDADASGLSPEEVGRWNWFSTCSQAEMLEEMITFNGGFFFLGIFLGLIFVMATVLIMYYKQVSEGYEDRARFQIMRQVGLPKKEIRRSVDRQVLLVFFAPLAVAAVHVAFDFRLMVQLLTLFTLQNVALTLWCTLGTLGLFAVIYVLVYRLTARVYYHIVSDEAAG